MRILFLTQRLPYAPNRGDRIRAWHELQALSKGHEVHLLSLAHDADEESRRDDLHGKVASVTTVRVPRLANLARGLAALGTTQPLTHTLLNAPRIRQVLHGVVRRHDPGIVLAFCSSMARFALEPPLDNFPLILDMVDVDSEKWAALGHTAAPPKSWIYAREARYLRRFEAFATSRARLTFVVNEREAASLRAIAGPEAAVRVLQSGIDLEQLRPTSAPVKSTDVVFCGVMNYAPNEEGALWMAREVWPQVIAARPDARFVLLGANPTRALKHLPRTIPSIVVTGTVADVRPHLWEAAVSAAPLLVARGVQNKVLEAVAAGLPAVVTPVVAEGLPEEVMSACQVAESPQEFAQALIRGLAMPTEGRRALALSARLESLSWDKSLMPLLEAIERAAAP